MNWLTTPAICTPPVVLGVGPCSLDVVKKRIREVVSIVCTHTPWLVHFLRTASAAPMIPASFNVAAGTTLAFTVRNLKNFPWCLLAPPPKIIRSGQISFSRLVRYPLNRLAHIFQESSSLFRAASDADSSASSQSISICPSSVFGSRTPSVNKDVPSPVPIVTISTTPS